MAQEKRTENLIKKYLSMKRVSGDEVFFYKQFQTGATAPGLPDIIACIRGHFVGIEVKAPDGLVSEQQKVVAVAIAKAGGTFILVDDADDFIRWYDSQIWYSWTYKGIIDLTKSNIVW